MSSEYSGTGDEVPLAIKKNLTTLGEIISKAIAGPVADRLSEKRISLEQNIDEPTRLLFVDGDRIAEALCILLSFMSDHCPTDGNVTLQSLVGEAGHTEFSLSSNAGNVTDEKPVDIFNLPPNRDAASESTMSEIGLAKAKRIVELHDGEIWSNLKTDRATEIGFYLVS